LLRKGTKNDDTKGVCPWKDRPVKIFLLLGGPILGRDRKALRGTTRGSGKRLITSMHGVKRTGLRSIGKRKPAWKRVKLEGRGQ